MPQHQVEDILMTSTPSHDELVRKNRKLQKALYRIKSEIKKANADQRELVDNVSHKIHTPVNDIIKATELLLQTDLTAKQQQYLDKIKNSAGILLNLTKDFLDYPQITSPKPELEDADRKLDILLAEDNLVNQALAVDLLEAKGHRVVAVLNGEEALKAFAKDSFDVILMDVQMPKMDGLEATKHIRSLERKKRRMETPNGRGRAAKIDRVPIVALTAHTRESDRQKCLDAGMDDYMSKPIKPEELFQIVERLSKPATEKKEKRMSAVAADAPTGKDVFDPVKALEVVAGKRKLLQELVQIFLENLPEYVANIRGGISNRDAGVLERSVHALKGAVANFGARRAYDAAYRLEQLGKQSKMDEAEHAMSVLDKELGTLERSLRSYLKGIT